MNYVIIVSNVRLSSTSQGGGRSKGVYGSLVACGKADQWPGFGKREMESDCGRI